MNNEYDTLVNTEFYRGLCEKFGFTRNVMPYLQTEIDELEDKNDFLQSEIDLKDDKIEELECDIEGLEEELKEAELAMEED